LYIVSVLLLSAAVYQLPTPSFLFFSRFFLIIGLDCCNLRKLAAISLLLLVLFNLVGYHLVVNFLQDRQEARLDANLDHNQYNDQDLVIIKLPVNLPYYNNSATYERVSGSVEVRGVEYKYVKRRIYNDSIELACIPNLDKQKFQSVKNDFLKLNNDLQNNHSGKKSTSIKNPTLDFCNQLITYSFQQNTDYKQKPFLPGTPALAITIKTVQEQPPDFI
jgi:hypothetical protein